MLREVVPNACRVCSISMFAPSSFMSALVRFATPSSRVLIILSVKSCLAVMILRLLDNSFDSVLNVVFGRVKICDSSPDISICLPNHLQQQFDRPPELPSNPLSPIALVPSALKDTVKEFVFQEVYSLIA